MTTPCPAPASSPAYDCGGIGCGFRPCICGTERRWHFRCAVCEFDHEEAGRLATDTEIHCPLCAEDNHRLVALRRWL